MVSLLAALLACATPEPVDAPAEAPEVLRPDPALVLTRSSLDLRGVRPSPDELDRLEADPDALDDMVRAWLRDPRFEDRVRDLWAEVYQTRKEAWPWEVVSAQPDPVAFSASIGEEPLRILGRVAAEDLPVTDIVTADWTMVDHHLARAWSTDYPADGQGWQVARYTDGRPGAGVLSTNGMWWATLTSESNLNRARANTIARVFTCRDYLDQPVRFAAAFDLSDPEGVRAAVHDNPSCATCHSTLDPLAAYLFGFHFDGKGAPEEQLVYHPEREGLWRPLLGAAPAWYGQPGDSLSDLGRQVAADPRFAECLTRQAFEQLLQRPATLDDTATLNAHREALIRGDARLRPLIESVVLGDDYRAVGLPGGPRKLATPELLETQVRALTGFRFTVDGASLLRTDNVGVRVIAGGVDGELSTRPVREATPPLILVQRRLAEAASDAAVRAWRAAPQRAPVLAPLDLDDTRPEALAEAFAWLERAVLGRRLAPDDAEVLDLVDTFQQAEALTGEPDAAWVLVLTVLLSDPDLVLY